MCIRDSAPPLHQLVTGSHPNEHSSVLERFCIDLRIVESHFIFQMIRVNESNALDDVQGVAREMFCGIEPALPVKSLRIDHERVAFIASNGATHPRGLD